MLKRGVSAPIHSDTSKQPRAVQPLVWREVLFFSPFYSSRHLEL